MTLTLAERLSRYALSIRFEDMPADVLVEAKKRIVDGLGCAVGAFEAEPVKVARRVAERVKSSKPATILGTSVKTAPELAAFVNGIMVRYFDYNDTYLGREPAHPSDNISACLAVAESVGATGRDFLLATALAYEVQCRLCDAADIRHRGWDHVNYGLVSTALAAGRLMGLNEDEMTQAVNISLNAHIAMRQVRAGELSMWKGASFAEAARNGVFSAELAREGMTGPSPIFEGEMGFFKQVSGPFSLDTDAFGGKKGRFKIADTIIKYFPAEVHSQSAIWAAKAVRKELPSLSEVAAVEIDSHEAGFTILGNDPAKWRPTTKETADHSLPYIVTMALKEGNVDNSTYAPSKLADGGTVEFLKKVTVKEDKSFSQRYPEAIANRVTVRLKSGKVYSRQVDYPKGHPKDPMSTGEVEAKFRRLTTPYLSEGSAKEALSALWSLESLDDVTAIPAMLTIRS